MNAGGHPVDMVVIQLVDLESMPVQGIVEAPFQFNIVKEPNPVLQSSKRNSKKVEGDILDIESIRTESVTDLDRRPV